MSACLQTEINNLPASLGANVVSRSNGLLTSLAYIYPHLVKLVSYVYFIEISFPTILSISADTQ